MSRVKDREEIKGWIHGIAGMAIFAGSLPATRMALQGFEPLFLTSARILMAALFAGLFLFVGKRKIPHASLWMGLVWVTLGVVIGFPLCTALALQYVPSTHALIFVALLPIVTAAIAVLRARERLKPAFWLIAFLGSTLVVAYGLHVSKGSLAIGDIWMVVAIAVAGIGYAEGGRLARSIGGPAVISWSLLLGVPLFLPILIFFWPPVLPTSSFSWFGLAYVGLFSQFIGFFFWYRGMAQVGIAKIGQLQLIQPFLGIFFAALLLGEAVDGRLIFSALGVILCVGLARRFA